MNLIIYIINLYKTIMEDKNMFFGIPTYLFASIFDEIIPDIITKDFKKGI